MNKKIQPSFIRTADGKKIAYHKYAGRKKNLPGVIFCGGFRSDMGGSKAMALDKFCRKHGISFLRFDYTGHGQSQGTFEEGTIGRWKDDALFALDKLTTGKQILIGSSMGGWIGLMLTLARPKRVATFIGIASAPDFTEYLVWDKLDKKSQEEIKKKGCKYFPSDFDCSEYAITWDLIKDGRNHLLLHKEIPITCPVRLIHGMKDDDVPYDTSLKIAQKLKTKDVQVIFKKDGDHRMSEPSDIALLLSVLQESLGV